MTALEKSWNRETYAYFMEMGTGKTKVLIDNLAMLYDKGKVDGALIIAPKGVIGTWYNNELPIHLPKHIENVTIMWQSNITKKQQEKLETLFEIETALHILIMIALSCSTTPVPVPETPTKISHPSLDMSSPLSEGIINQYDVWQFLKQKPEESEVFDLLGLPDSVWTSDDQKYKVLYYYVEFLDDYNSVEINVKSMTVNSFEWD